MDNSQDSGWQVDRLNSLVTHADGFAAEMAMGQVRNIVRLPPGIAPRDIRRYIIGAERAWAATPPTSISFEVEAGETSKIAARIGHGPARRPNVPKPAAESTQAPTQDPNHSPNHSPNQSPPLFQTMSKPQSKNSPTITVKRRRKPLLKNEE